MKKYRPFSEACLLPDENGQNVVLSRACLDGLLVLCTSTADAIAHTIGIVLADVKGNMQGVKDHT